MAQGTRAEPAALQDASSLPASALWTQDLHLSARAILIGILALAAVLRFALLGQNSVWFDEAFTVRVTQFPWQAIPLVLRSVDAHPPLYYLLMKAWISLAGAGETAIRLPSACFSLVSVALTYALVRRLASEPVSLLSAFLVSVSPFQIMAGQEARMYPLLGLLALASTLALVLCTEHGSPLRWAAYVVLGTLMAYTHYLAFFVLIAHGLWIACCERRSLLPWLASMAAATILYTPWLPSLWYQTAHGNGWPYTRYADKPVYLKIGDLFGLFAFGGSLFGTPTYYFSNTPLLPIEQLIILLPFLALLGRGIASWSSDRRGLALVGLPPLVSLAGPLALSLVRPTFIARWFSYLLPFYAMVLARGLVDVAESLRGRRDRILAFLTAGLLLYNAVVLSHYYFDPAFHPWQWRVAATLIEERARPDDVFLFGDAGNALAFQYYYKKSHLAMKLLPRPDFAAVRRLATDHRRVWLIVAPPFDEPLLQRTMSEVRGVFRVAGQSRLNGTRAYPWVYLLEAMLPGARSR